MDRLQEVIEGNLAHFRAISVCSAVRVQAMSIERVVWIPELLFELARLGG